VGATTADIPRLLVILRVEDHLDRARHRLLL
jgi:hypothetical protein